MMTMKNRFYLNEKSRLGLVRRVLKEMREMIQSERYFNRVYANGTSFDLDDEGVFVALDTFVGGIPARLADLPIRKVTLYDEGGNIWPRLGVYKQDAAKAIVDSFTTQVENRDEGFDSYSRYEGRWRIRVIGPNFEAVVRLKRAIRSATIH